MLAKKFVPIILIFVGTLVTLVSACPPIPIGDLAIGHRWVRPSTSQNTAAYVTITNNSTTPDKLIRVDCAHATTVELHTNIIEDGIAHMEPVDFIEIGNGQVELKPGGLHIMLMGLKPSFQELKEVPLTLNFEKAGPLSVNFHIKQPDN